MGSINNQALLIVLQLAGGGDFPMNTKKALSLAGVPEALHAEALASIAKAKEAKRGLLWHKLKVRLFRAKKIAKMIPWHADRLIDVRPDLASWDIEPVTKITAQGDKGGWTGTEGGGRPIEGEWLNPDPASEEYKLACETNHYSPGLHPRSVKSRTNWYRRNGGAHEAYMRGEICDPAQYAKPWQRGGLSVHRNNGMWQITGRTKLWGWLPVKLRLGFEIDNVFSGVYYPQAWFAIAGYDLRAPVSWSVMPGG